MTKIPKYLIKRAEAEGACCEAISYLAKPHTFEELVKEHPGYANWAIYNLCSSLAWEKYKTATESAWEMYEVVVTSARKTLNAVDASAREMYEAAVASARLAALLTLVKKES